MGPGAGVRCRVAFRIEPLNSASISGSVAVMSLQNPRPFLEEASSQCAWAQILWSGFAGLMLPVSGFIEGLIDELDKEVHRSACRRTPYLWRGLQQGQKSL